MMEETSTESPSKVLHVRSLPVSATESDVAALASPFGQVEKILLIQKKQQALVQMQDEYHAASLLAYYAHTPATIQGTQVIFQYSRRNEIQSTPVNAVLMVSVSMLTYPVTVDTLYQVFSRFGPVLRIVSFQKRTFQAFVEFADEGAAQRAREVLDGKNLYEGCCKLRVEYSSQYKAPLRVVYNNERTRDFTDPSKPPGPVPAPALPLSSAPPATAAAAQSGAALPTPSAAYPFDYPHPSGYAHFGVGKGVVPGMGLMGGAGAAGGAMNSPVLIVSGLNPERMDPDAIFTLFGCYGDVIRVKILFNKTDTALVQFISPQHAESACTHLNGLTVFGQQLRVNYSKHLVIQAGRNEDELTKDFLHSALHRFKKPGSKNFHHICPPSNMLHLSNVGTSDAEAVGKMFAVYGGVEGVQFFANDPRMCLVKMVSVESAAEALVGLHGTMVEGKELRVTFTRTQFRKA